MATNDGFVREIFAMVKERRSFGRHPIWHRIADGKVSQAGLCAFAVQFFLQVREFPRALSALHSRCFNADERVKLAESLYEEETGRISGSAPHPELFIRLGLGLGLSRDDMIHGKPLPSTAALIDWFELSTKDRSFAEGIGAINLAAEARCRATSRRSPARSKKITGCRAIRSHSSTFTRSPIAITATSATIS